MKQPIPRAAVCAALALGAASAAFAGPPARTPAPYTVLREEQSFLPPATERRTCRDPRCHPRPVYRLPVCTS